jgi:predicted DNA-binding protein
VSKDKQVKVTFYASEEQRQRIRQLSDRTRVSQADYFREAIDDLLEKYRSQLEDITGKRKK